MNDRDIDLEWFDRTKGIWGVQGISASEWCRLRDLVKRMRAERDQARREICDWVSDGKRDPKAIAKRYGWDCFKEVEP